MKNLLIFFMPFYLFASEISIQVLGSGGPELGKRASASYIIKRDNKALILIDFGGGAFLRFGQAKANLEDLEAVLLTHLHIDHVVDLPALMKAGYFSQRTRPLAIVGPNSNNYFPSISEYLDLQFGKNGAYRYMSDILTSDSDSFTIYPQQVDSKKELSFNGFTVTSIPVEHGIVPSLAYKIDIDGKRIVFSGDTTAHDKGLEILSKNADILIAHHAIPQEGYHAARRLHMTPERIAQIASVSTSDKLLLSHRMKRTYGAEQESSDIITKHYQGKIIWAEDLMNIDLP
jgi:ribonuclease BN (tRNA processing enzyme)